MSKVITVSNQKGGTGKSAMSFEIGKILSKDNRVLFIDLDGQGDLTRTLLKEDDHPLVSTLDVLKGEIDAREAVLNINSHVSLLPSTDDLLRADIDLTNKGRQVSECLNHAIESLKNEYDYVVVDTPPNLGVLTINALKSADLIYIPMLAENNSIDGLLNFIKAFTAVNDTREDRAVIEGIIVTRWDGRSTINKGMMESIEAIADKLSVEVYPIKETVKLREAHYYGKSITEYTPKNAVSKQLVDMVNHLNEREDMSL